MPPPESGNVQPDSPPPEPAWPDTYPAWRAEAEPGVWLHVHNWIRNQSIAARIANFATEAAFDKALADKVKISGYFPNFFSFRKWVKKRAIWEAFDILRREKLFQDNLDRLIRPTTDPGDLWNYINELEVSESTIIFLRYRGGYTLEEAAEILGMSVTTVWRLQQTALKKLRECLSQESRHSSVFGES